MGFIKHQPACTKFFFTDVEVSLGLMVLLIEKSDTVSTDEEEFFSLYCA